MKKLALFVLLINTLAVFSQSSIRFPAAWYRADSAAPGDTLWADQSGHGHHARPGQEQLPGSGLLNYNRCFAFNGQAPAFSAPSSAFTNEIAVMIAYQTDDTLAERGLWALAGDSSFVGISTRRIFGSRMTIGYSDTNRTDPIVNTITQSWKVNEFNPARLLLGGTDTIFYKGKLGEVVVFDRRIGGKELLQWQSYLAVRHGITLCKLSYLNSAGDTTWHYNEHPRYSAAVSGLGRDTLFGLHQKQSVTDNRLSIGTGTIAASNALNPSAIPEGNFLIWGIDSNLFRFPENTYLQTGDELLTYGNCLMEATGEAIRALPTAVQIDVSTWTDVNPATCVLLIDRDHAGDFSGNTVEVYGASSIDTSGLVIFSGILWDSDGSGSDLFRIGFYPQNDTAETSTRSLIVGNSNEEAAHDGAVSAQANSYQLYPNPTPGNYNLTVSLTEVSDVVIRLISPDGKLLERREGKGQSEYRFTGSLPAKGAYLIEVESALERKALQLIHN